MFLLALVLAAPLRVGIVAAGGDAHAAGALSHATAMRLAATPEVAVVPPEELVRALALPAAPQPAPAPAAAMLQEAEGAYFAVELDEAVRKLDEAQSVLARTPDAFAERVRLHVLRGAVELKRGNTAAARPHLDAALSLDPDARADTLPPSLQDALENARAALPKRVTFKVAAVPEDATVLVDGRTVVAGVIAVLPGTRVISVSAPGFREVRRAIAVSRDASTRIALAPALPADLETALASWNAGEAPPALASLADAIGADRILVLTSRGAEARTAMWVRDGQPLFGGPFAPGGESALGAWAADAARGTGALASTSRTRVGPRDPARRPPSGTRTPLVKRPLFWGAVGLGVAAIAAGAVAASAGGADGGTRTEPSGETTVHW